MQLFLQLAVVSSHFALILFNQQAEYIPGSRLVLPSQLAETPGSKLGMYWFFHTASGYKSIFITQHGISGFYQNMKEKWNWRKIYAKNIKLMNTLFSPLAHSYWKKRTFMLYTSSVCQTQPLLPLLLLLLSLDRNVLILFQPYAQVKLYSQEPVALQPSDIYTAALAEVLKKGIFT